MLRYVIKQRLSDGTVWTSPEIFSAPAFHAVKQAVIAGYLAGQARWAETSPTETREPPAFIYGIDARGLWASADQGQPGVDTAQFIDRGGLLHG